MHGKLGVFFPREWIMRCEKLLHVIAISQAGIAGPTLTVMQDFETKKKLFRAHSSRSCVYTP